MAEAQFYAKLVWSGGALGPTRSAERYSPGRVRDPALYNPEDLLLSSVAACHMLSYLAVCTHAGTV